MRQLRTIFTAFLILATVASCFTARHYYRQYTRCTTPPPAMPQSNGAASPISAQAVDTFTDAAGQHHTVLATPDEIGRRRAGQVADKAVRPFLESVSASVGVKLHDLESISVVQLQAARDSIHFLTHALDDQRRATRTYKDRYLTLLVRDPAPGDSTDTVGSFDFRYNAELTTADYSRRRKVLGMRIGRREYFTDISSNDPRMHIAGAGRYTLQRRVPALGFRLQALTSYNLETQSQTAGLGVRFDAGDRFNCGLNYTYNFRTGMWAPTLYAKYDLLQAGR